MFNRQAEYQAQLEWLVTMASDPNWKAYAWERAQELAKEELFSGIDKELIASMRGRESGQASEGRSTKRH
jgi:hypothetical protein